MSAADKSLKPQLRPVEVHPVALDGEDGAPARGFAVRDPTGISDAALTISEPVLFILSLCDGGHDLAAIRLAFLARYGQPLEESTLTGLIDGLEKAYLLHGDAFDRYHAGLVADYQAAPTRRMRSAADLGLDENTAEQLDALLDTNPASVAPANGRVVGLVAPHLDYPRGAPCYAAAYSALRGRPVPDRVVILGTNHFGQSTGVVATGKDFETPLGTTRTDRGLLARLTERCGELCAGEFDHAREHSIELQLLLCQHVWGAGAFAILAVLCPDPCGPTGTAPADGRGVDLRDFAEALGAIIRADEGDTLVIAGADLSHIGPQFGDEQPIDAAFRTRVEKSDRAALAHLVAGTTEQFVAQVAEADNPTRVCSAGCIAALRWALPDADATLLGYHQAVDAAGQVGVTCAAVALHAGAAC
jgi:AmmeMemoRadiSam system protein B